MSWKMNFIKRIKKKYNAVFWKNKVECYNIIVKIIKIIKRLKWNVYLVKYDWNIFCIGLEFKSIVFFHKHKID